jgi:hypothetical protein
MRRLVMAFLLMSQVGCGENCGGLTQGEYLPTEPGVIQRVVIGADSTTVEYLAGDGTLRVAVYRGGGAPP